MLTTCHICDLTILRQSCFTLLFSRHCNVHMSIPFCCFPWGRQINVQIYSNNANPTPHAKDMSSTEPRTKHRSTNITLSTELTPPFQQPESTYSKATSYKKIPFFTTDLVLKDNCSRSLSKTMIFEMFPKTPQNLRDNSVLLDSLGSTT